MDLPRKVKLKPTRDAPPVSPDPAVYPPKAGPPMAERLRLPPPPQLIAVALGCTCRGTFQVRSGGLSCPSVLRPQGRRKGIYPEGTYPEGGTPNQHATSDGGEYYAFSHGRVQSRHCNPYSGGPANPKHNFLCSKSLAEGQFVCLGRCES